MAQPGRVDPHEQFAGLRIGEVERGKIERPAFAIGRGRSPLWRSRAAAIDVVIGAA